jgi:hypothetical protein
MCQRPVFIIKLTRLLGTLALWCVLTASESVISVINAEKYHFRDWISGGVLTIILRMIKNFSYTGSLIPFNLLSQ